jgi:hypothetical protein
MSMEGPAARVYNSFENLTNPRLNRGLSHDQRETNSLALRAAILSSDDWADIERFAKARAGFPCY